MHARHHLGMLAIMGQITSLGIPGRVVQSVTCLRADACLTANPGVKSQIPARSHAFMEIDHGMLSTVNLLPSAYSRRIVGSYKRKYVHEVLVNSLVKLAQEKSDVMLTDHPNMTIAADQYVTQQPNLTTN